MLLSQPDSSHSRFSFFGDCEHFETDYPLHGFQATGEFDRCLRCESPFDFLDVDGHFRIFSVTCDLQAFSEQSELLLDFFGHELRWLRKQRLLCGGLQSKPARSENRNEKEVVHDMYIYLAFLRYRSYKLSQQSVALDEILALLNTLYWIHSEVGPLRSEDKDRPLLHLLLTAKWTVIVCLRYLCSSTAMPEWSFVSSVPSFCSFQGDGWNHRFLMACQILDGHLNTSTLEATFQQLCLAFLVELTDLALKRMADYETASIHATHGWSSRQYMLTVSPFHCHCVKESWKMLMKLLVLHFNGIWAELSNLFIAASPTNLLPPPKDQHNTYIMQFVYIERPKKLFFWLLHYLAPWVADFADGAGAALTESGYEVIRQMLLNEANAIEELMNLNIVHRTCFLWGPSIHLLHDLWPLFHKWIERRCGSTRISVEDLAIVPPELSDWLKMVDKFRSPQPESMCQSVPHAFLSILSCSLTHERNCRKSKMTSQIFSRVHGKISPQNRERLDERSFFHVLSIYLVMISVAPPDALARILDGLYEIVSVDDKGCKPISNGTTTLMLLQASCTAYLLALSRLGDSCVADSKTLAALSNVSQGISVLLQRLVTSDNSPVMSKALTTFSHFVQHPYSMHSNLSLGQSSVVGQWLIQLMMQKERRGSDLVVKEIGYVFQGLSSVVMRLKRYYDGLPHLMALSQEERDLKVQVDHVTGLIWRKLYSALEAFVCNKVNRTAFEHCAELVYTLMLFSHHCAGLKALWPDPASAPLFKDPKAVFRSMAQNDRVSVVFTTAFLSLLVQGDLHADKVVPLKDLFECWAKCAILMPALCQALDPSLLALEQTSEAILPAILLAKPDPPGNDILVQLIARVSQGRHLVGDLVERYCEPVLNAFRSVSLKTPDDEKIRQRLIKVASELLNGWMFLLYSETGQGRVIRNEADTILKRTLLRQEFLDDSLVLSTATKSVIQAALPKVFMALAQLHNMATNHQTVRRIIRDLAKMFLFRFKLDIHHPFTELFRTPELSHLGQMFVGIIGEVRPGQDARKAMYDEYFRSLMSRAPKACGE